MVRMILIAFLVLCPSFLIQAQNLEGVIRSATGRTPIPYANIFVAGTGIGTVSHFDGRFKLNVSSRPKGKDSLVVKALGYDTKYINIKAGMDTMFIYLQPASVELSSVLVSPKSPEYYIQQAAEKIPENYIDEYFNGVVYQRKMIRLNGKFMESTEAIMKGYIAPVHGDRSEKTRVKMLAYNYFDEEEEALESIVSRRRKRKGDKMAIKGLDSMMLEVGRQMGEEFDIYTQLDSNLIVAMHEGGPEMEGAKFWFDNIAVQDGRQLMNIGFKGRLGGVANQRGQVLLDYETLAVEAFSIQVRSSSLKIRMLLKLMGINFNGVDVVFRFKSIQSEAGWIPDLLSADIFVDLEKIKLFSRNIPIRIEINTYTRFLEVEVPATDKCDRGMIVKRRTPLQEQFEDGLGSEVWKKYEGRISRMEKN